jgi:hypothetical protein
LFLDIWFGIITRGAAGNFDRDLLTVYLQPTRQVSGIGTEFIQLFEILIFLAGVAQLNLIAGGR